jgi:hypothetical protein
MKMVETPARIQADFGTDAEKHIADETLKDEERIKLEVENKILKSLCIQK